MHPNPDQQSRQPSVADDAGFGWVVSVCFWSTLFIAAAIYATVALAPKLERLIGLRHRYHAGQLHLVELEGRVRNLNRVARALEEDPEFSAELSRLRFRPRRPGGERIPVEDELSLQFAADSGTRAAAAVPLPWYSGAVSEFAGNQQLRKLSLVVAGAIVLIGFAFLNSGHERQVQAVVRGVQRSCGAVAGRYREDVARAPEPD